MKLELRKLSIYALLNIILLGCVFSYAQASGHPSDTSKAHNSAISMASKSRNAVKFNLLAEETDKLINNVKVFYNPISEQITVNFKLGKEYNVVVKVMDALGNEVLNLHNATLDAGMQNLNFDTQQKLPEGFYFVRVSAGTETVVKRISVR